MDLIVLLAITYIAAGLVYLIREADEIAQDHSVSLNVPPMLQVLAGLVIMLFWPVFLLAEFIKVDQHPMAIKIDEAEPR
jgi:hypothetical protein